MCDDVRASLVALSCLVRGLPLLFAAQPKTPLRVLAIMALDTVHTLRHARPMPARRVRELALFFDYGACANAIWDRKDYSQAESLAMRQDLDAAGHGTHIDEYLAGLRALESRRPSIGGTHRNFDAVRAYREDVVRLSLATAVAIAIDAGSVANAVSAIERDSDLDALFRIAMQCQVIDDVLDYSDDLSAGLPSLVTAVSSLSASMEMTAGAARAYGATHERPSGPSAFPFRMALRVVSALTTLVAVFARRHRRHAEHAATC